MSRNDNAEAAILVATYNGEKYLDVQLQSIIDQTFESFVCYIQDDGSNDGTIDIIRKYESLYPEKFIFLPPKQGLGAARNFLSLADYVRKNTEEPYIFFCDQDDYWAPTKIERQIELLKTNERVLQPLLVYCDQEIVDGDLNTIAASGMHYIKRKAGVDDSFKRLTFWNCAAGCTLCFNRCLLNVAIDGLDIDRVVMHDWWFMLVARCYGNILYVDEPLMKYRQHGYNALGANDKSFCRRVRKYLHAFRKSVNRKKAHVLKSEIQIGALHHLNGKDYSNKYGGEIKEFLRIKGMCKVKRMYMFARRDYFKPKDYFTLLFV